MSKSLTTYAHEKFIQYEIMTGVYVMEPWEKTLFNAVFLLVVSLSMATFYQYTPSMLGKVSGLF